jgi:hypothetical protein
MKWSTKTRNFPQFQLKKIEQILKLHVIATVGSTAHHTSTFHIVSLKESLKLCRHSPETQHFYFETMEEKKLQLHFFRELLFNENLSCHYNIVAVVLIFTPSCWKLQHAISTIHSRVLRPLLMFSFETIDTRCFHTVECLEIFHF